MLYISLTNDQEERHQTSSDLHSKTSICIEEVFETETQRRPSEESSHHRINQTAAKENEETLPQSNLTFRFSIFRSFELVNKSDTPKLRN